MKQYKAGLVGIGRLGSAMMTHWHKNDIRIGVFHHVNTKAEQFVQQFQNGYCLSKEELSELDVLILALPAMEVIPFIANLPFQHSTYLINMATNLPTQEIITKFPSLNINGVKFMGHWRDLMEHGNGLFITETSLPPEIDEIYQYLGKIKMDKEEALTQVNKLATYYAVKAAIEIETEFSKKGIPIEYIKRAMTSLAPEVIRSYSEGNLGHFAMEIVKEIQAKE